MQSACALGAAHSAGHPARTAATSVSRPSRTHPHYNTRARIQSAATHRRESPVVQVWYAIKRLALGLVLIALASAVLLVSDRDRRTVSAATGRVWRVAIVQHASTPVLD